jgi:hypothetical protein
MINKIAQEIAKRVMRESYLFQTCSTVFPLKGNTGQLLLTPSLAFWDFNYDTPSVIDGGSSGLDSNKAIYPSCWDGSTPDMLTGMDALPNQKTAAEVLRVLRVRIARVPYLPSSTFLGWVVLSPSSAPYVLPAPATAGAGGFYLIYGTATITDPDNNPYDVKTGDMFQSNGSEWLSMPIEKYNTLAQMNKQTVDRYSVRPQSNFNSTMCALQWSQHYGQMTAAQDSIPGGGGSSGGGTVPPTWDCPTSIAYPGSTTVVPIVITVTCPPGSTFTWSISDETFTNPATEYATIVTSGTNPAILLADIRDQISLTPAFTVNCEVHIGAITYHLGQNIVHNDV